MASEPATTGTDMWRQGRKQLGERRWLLAALVFYVALTSVEALRLLAFDPPQVDAAGVYDLEFSPATPAAEPRPEQLVEDGGAPGAPSRPELVQAVPTAANRILVSWTASSEQVRGYKLQHALLGDPWQTIWATPSQVRHEFTVGPGATICFRVRSYSESGHSLYAYPESACVVAAEPDRFRWTADRATLIEPPGGAVLTLAMRPGRETGDGVLVGVSVDGEPLEHVALRGAEWHTFRYYLPILAPARRWDRGASAAGDPDLSAGGAPVDAPTGRVDGTGLAELGPWGRDAGTEPMQIDLTVDPTFVPADVVDGSGDRRELGVQLAVPLQWSSRVPPDGIGFHDWEESPDGRRFRWTRKQASQPAAPAGSTVTFSLRVNHPDLDRQPVRVRMFWNERELPAAVLPDRTWKEVAIDISAGVPGILSLRVDRTWVPADTDGGDDRRSLGVAMTAVEWR